jgi:hypothetical protein
MSAFGSASQSTNSFRDPNNGLGSHIQLSSNSGYVEFQTDNPLLEGWVRSRMVTPTNTGYFTGKAVVIKDQLNRIIAYTVYNVNPARIEFYVYSPITSSFVNHGSYETGKETTLFYDLNFKIHDTNGFIKFYVNNFLVAQFLGNTKAYADTLGASVFTFMNDQPIGSTYIGNIIVATERTLGMLVRNLPATAAGSVSQMAGTFSDVNKTSQNDDTGLTSTVADQTTTLNLNSPPASGNSVVKKVVMNLRAVRGETGPQKVNGVVRTGGALFNGPDLSPDTFVKTLTTEWDLNPSTGNPWTFAELVALEAGVRSRT